VVARFHEPVRFDPGGSRHWRLGGLDLFVRRMADGWLVQTVIGHSEEELDRPDILATAVEWEPGNSATDVIRYYSGKDSSDVLRLTPLLPDRPVVARPREPFAIAPGQSANLFLGVPLWLELVTGDAAHLVAHPSARLADTWFGPSTLSGELCYASITHCRTSLEEMIESSWRAVTPLVLENHGKDVWSLDRVALPVPLLPLFRAADGRYWTSELSAVRERSGEVDAVRAGQSAPAGVRGPAVAEPRQADRSSWLGRFYGNVLSASGTGRRGPLAP